MPRKLLAAGLLAISAFALPQEASAVPGLSSSKSVKEITQMLRQYAGTNASNIHQVEAQLRDRPAEACEALVNILDTSDEQLQIHASQLLSRMSSNHDFYISDETLKTVVGILKASPNPTVRQNLLATLGHVGPKNEMVKSTIVNAAKNSSEPGTRKAAVEALANLAREEKPSMHATSTALLLAALQTDDAPIVRCAAAQALGNYKDNSSAIVPALTAALDDNYLRVRTSAAQALGNYGSAALPAKSKLIECLKEESDHSIRYNSMHALRRIAPRDPEFLDAQIAILNTDQNMIDNILNDLQNVGPRGAAAVPKLIPLLSDTHQHRQIAAARVLQSIGPGAKSALPALRAALQSSSPRGTHSCFEEAIREIERDTTSGAQASNQ